VAISTHDRARALRKAQTDAEARLWAHLRAGRLEGLKFRRQFPIGSFLTDFCCREKRLIVEVDGGHHAARRDADSRREEALCTRGYRILRFWNNEVLGNIEGAIERIRENCAHVGRPHPCPLPGQGEGEQRRDAGHGNRAARADMHP
jgi:very-short-patch-repair endonuclease